MNSTKRLWILLGTVIFMAMFILGWFGRVHRTPRPSAAGW